MHVISYNFVKERNINLIIIINSNFAGLRILAGVIDLGAKGTSNLLCDVILIFFGDLREHQDMALVVITKTMDIHHTEHSGHLYHTVYQRWALHCDAFQAMIYKINIRYILSHMLYQCTHLRALPLIGVEGGEYLSLLGHNSSLIKHKGNYTLQVISPV